ncbi:ribosomal RNA small subunit methyltransferase A [Candidatus Wolfebacteria bacterium RIFCSPLOWO2_01_FULL_45_19]|uniref:Ribosomal RNA small subunit methyltransferase A n=1 Tax=Candidatus Wolfebacteria bacterium RIFCSPLOWO2_01_FULL_45_19 TaxID=1802557 RepID=A0A1F8DS96_9BACT|nr:MAG: ribosomal RNA small subunit methyltransferase A [Candidatus Wolfebacteria bacterium RIFCSPLOWO2_01_FULL_45_19]
MKRLGQHFLINKEKIKKIIQSLELKNGETIIEIGPGHGELTRELLAISFKLLEEDGRGMKIIAIEKDKALTERLNKTFADHKNVETVLGDALKVIPKIIKNYKLQAKSYKLVGNIPYYITGYLLRIISELARKPKLCVFTVQKEVAERICAQPPKMNLLAASVQFWAKPEIIDFISKKYFKPAPKVDSAIIKLTIHPKPYTPNQEHYYKLIKILFKQPRKTLINNLSGGYRQMSKEKLIELIKKTGLEPNLRPQNLNLEKILGISKFLT